MKNYKLLLVLLLFSVVAAFTIARFIPGLPPERPARAIKFSNPQRFDAYVVKVLDGDTVDVIDVARNQTRIRLRGIDAPEKSQAFGSASREHLANLIFNRHVLVVCEETDRYGRMIGAITIDERDAGLHMVQAGMAWHFKRYEMSQPVDERMAYALAEAEARKANIGLWSEPSPIAPWDFRKKGRR